MELINESAHGLKVCSFKCFVYLFDEYINLFMKCFENYVDFNPLYILQRLDK